MCDYKNELTEIFPQTKKIYNSLIDEQSRKTFAFRMLYNLTEDWNYLFDAALLTPEYDKNNINSFRDVYNQYKSVNEAYPLRNLIIFGAGRWGRTLLEVMSLTDLRFHSFCDSDINKQNETYCGLPVISPAQLLQDHKQDFVVIGSQDYKKEINQQLVSMGFPADHILSGELEKVKYQLEFLFDKQYFEAPIIMPQEDEIFVDGGCFNCDTSIRFKKWCNEKYKKIYAFEPDPQNYKQCKEIIRQKDIKNMELFNAGLWSKNDTLYFDAGKNASSTFINTGTINVPVVSLDQMLNGQRASFVKLDVEGSELEALKGAKNTILLHRPRLAICVYHKHEDILQIPLYLQSLVPDYRFYIRDYSNHSIETVLYAV